MRIFNTMLAAIAALFMGAAIAAAHETHGGSDADGVRHVLMHMFDKPDAPLKVDPIAVADGFAVAGWVQGEMGGRAFLRKDGDQWKLILCAGDSIRSPDALVISGVPAETAARLAAEIATLEQNVPAETLALMAGFEGVVRMDTGEHPTH